MFWINKVSCHTSNSFLLPMLGDRPYKCDKCHFRFYKNSDLEKHRKSCKGLIYSCDTCAASFHFKKKLHHHLIWSKMCGILKGLEGVCSTDSTDSLVSKIEQEANEQKRMSDDQNVIENLSIVRLNVTEKTSIILVNCENLLDKEFYEKRSKRSKCGFCVSCELVADCMNCVVCKKHQNCIPQRCRQHKNADDDKATSPSRNWRCSKRKCIYPIFNVSIKDFEPKPVLT